MILVRAWRRQLLGGLGAAVVVPATLLAALAVLALAGGFAGLGALGQAFSGPALPAAQTAAAPSTHAGRAVSPVVFAALSSPSAATTGTAAGTGRGSAGGHPRSTAAPRTGGGAPRPPAPPPTSSSTPPSSPPPPPSPSPSPHPTVTDQLVAAVTSVTSQLPSPAGPAATGALQSASATVDQVLPVPAPGPPQVP